LTWVADGSSQAMPTTPSAVSKTKLIPWLVAALLSIGAFGIGYFSHKSNPEKPLWLSVPTPGGTEMADTPLISPDGTRIVFPAKDKDGTINLWIRSFQSPNFQKIPGTEAANYPFWSPDSRFIPFFASGKLIKMDPAEAHSQVLCDVSDERGGTWNQFGDIVFTPNPLDGLYRISSSGGTPEQITSLDPAGLESSHRFPQFLPDGKHFIFYVKANKA